MGVDKPNYTQIPNLLLDDIMRYMDGNELKVTLAIARQTFGFHREKIKLTISDIEELTGLSRPSVTTALDVGIRRRMIRREVGDDGKHTYSIIINDDVIAGGKEILPVKEFYRDDSKEILPTAVKKVYRDGKEILPKAVKKVDTLTPTLKKEKETIKEKEEEEDHHHHPLLSESIGAAWSDTYGDDMPLKIKKAIVPLLAECGEAAVIHGITASASSSSRSFKYIAECARNYIPPAPAAPNKSYHVDVTNASPPSPTVPAAPTAPPPPLVTSDPWAVILSELQHELMPDAPAHKWLRSSALLRVGDVVGVPLYQVQIADAAGVSWLSNRLAATIRKKLSVLLRQRVLVEIVCTEKELVA